MRKENQDEKMKGDEKSPIKHQKHLKGGEKTNTEFYIQLVIIGVLAILLVFNIGKLSIKGNVVATGNAVATGIGTVSASDIIPTGVPEVYGKSLGVNYNDVSPNDARLADTTIKKLSQYEDIKLNDAQMTRYINIAGSISCEYCCGADSIIFGNGERACGCAHSYAMRGLGKYLITEYPNMSDDEILSELGKWKVLFFPGIHEQKAQVLESQGIDSKNYINLASNKYRGIEQGKSSGGAMVGGC
ncbi:hypothetical protein COU53_01125 [Candidatus Pacearchaeota archaeon CG10_big_fil_rev_8_21_14_0_10_30_48]|nr:MAG: hypothetical protein COU53_01125 [Candidatus Pacearchaeota archaeon CG10_big_fil_rev_8_21_14_0_10_30_48]